MKIDSNGPISRAARRMNLLMATGYLPDDFRRDIQILIEGALAYEVEYDSRRNMPNPAQRKIAE